MMVDLRQHVASLVAVFMALGIGITIGSALGSDGQLVQQQRRLVASLEAEFRRLQEHEQQLSQALDRAERRIEAYRAAFTEGLPQLVAGRLDLGSAPVAVVDTAAVVPASEASVAGAPVAGTSTAGPPAEDSELARLVRKVLASSGADVRGPEALEPGGLLVLVEPEAGPQPATVAGGPSTAGQAAPAGREPSAVEVWAERARTKGWSVLVVRPQDPRVQPRGQGERPAPGLAGFEPAGVVQLEEVPLGLLRLVDEVVRLLEPRNRPLAPAARPDATGGS